MVTGLGELACCTRATAIVGDILKIRASDVGLGDMAVVETPDGEPSLAQVIQLERDEVSLQVFSGGKGLSTQTAVRFLGHPTQVTYSPNILGRVFRGDATPIGGGPDLSGDRQVDIGGPSVNPVTRVVPTRCLFQQRRDRLAVRLDDQFRIARQYSRARLPPRVLARQQ
jgi:V/A-type H+/Na+-transporting ATPase subunit B